MALQYWASAKLCGVRQRVPPIFGRALAHILVVYVVIVIVASLCIWKNFNAQWILNCIQDVLTLLPFFKLTAFSSNFLWFVCIHCIRLFICLYICSISGVPVAYRSVRLLENYGYLMDDQPFIHVDVTVEYIAFCPREGCTVCAVINQKSNEHMSGLVLGLFNIAVTLRSKHTNEILSRVNSGHELLLKVTNIYVCTNGILSMRGRLRRHRSQWMWQNFVC